MFLVQVEFLSQTQVKCTVESVYATVAFCHFTETLADVIFRALFHFGIVQDIIDSFA